MVKPPSRKRPASTVILYIPSPIVTRGSVLAELLWLFLFRSIPQDSIYNLFKFERV